MPKKELSQANSTYNVVMIHWLQHVEVLHEATDVYDSGFFRQQCSSR